MDIVYKPESKLSTFGDIEVGEIFERHNTYYMKANLGDSTKCNAIEMTSGFGIMFYDSEEAVLCEAELTILGESERVRK